LDVAGKNVDATTKGKEHMTDKELQDFIDHGVNGFKEFSLLFGGTWASQAVVIAKEYQALLAQPEPEYKECRHCGFECRPNNNQSKKWYPLEQPEETVNGWPLYSGIPQPEKTKIHECPRCHCHFIDGGEILSQSNGKSWRDTPQYPQKVAAQPEPEEGDVPLYTLEQVKDVAQKLADCALISSPPKKEWVSLTDEEIFGMFGTYLGDPDYNHNKLLIDARRIEAKLKEKNT